MLSSTPETGTDYFPGRGLQLMVTKTAKVWRQDYSICMLELYTYFIMCNYKRNTTYADQVCFGGEPVHSSMVHLFLSPKLQGFRKTYTNRICTWWCPIALYRGLKDIKGITFLGSFSNSNRWSSVFLSLRSMRYTDITPGVL